MSMTVPLFLEKNREIYNHNKKYIKKCKKGVDFVKSIWYINIRR